MIHPKIKVKICRLQRSGNIREFSALNPDHLGFVFYVLYTRLTEPEKLKTGKNEEKEFLQKGKELFLL